MKRDLDVTALERKAKMRSTFCELLILLRLHQEKG